MRLDWNHLTVNLVNCGYSLWPAGVSHVWTWDNRVIPDNDLWIFDTGCCFMEMRGGKTRLKENSIIWMRPGHFYNVCQELDNPIGHVYIHFNLIKPDGSRYFPSVDEIPETFDCFNYAQWYAMAKNLVNITHIGKSVEENKPILPSVYSAVDNAMVVSAMLKAMLMGIDFSDLFSSRSEGHAGAGNRIALEAAQFLEENSNLFLPIQTVSKHFSLSRNRFTKVFTDFWHIPPQEYLIGQRIHKARRLLLETDWTLSEIAAALGYSDHFFFARQFKERTGISPGVFRKEHRVHHLLKNGFMEKHEKENPNIKI